VANSDGKSPRGGHRSRFRKKKTRPKRKNVFMRVFGKSGTQPQAAAVSKKKKEFPKKNREGGKWQTTRKLSHQ